MATHGFPGITNCGYYSCDGCGGVHERVLTDSWTGMDLCFECAHIVSWEVTMSPQEDGGDNLRTVLIKHGRLAESNMTDKEKEIHA